MMDIDFGTINARLLGQASSLLSQWFPAGRLNGHEFLIGALDGREGRSLSINVDTGKWADFSSSGDKGGDLISLYAAMKNIKQVDAARELAPLVGVDVPAALVKQDRKRDVVIPVPADTPVCDCVHYKYGAPSAVWTYRDAAGELLGHIARYDPDGDRKQIVPWTLARTPDGTLKWGAGQWAAPRPLFNLDDLAARPEAAVMVVEGEKAAVAARQIAAASYVVVTWPGGSQAHTKVDWSPLKGRKVLLWPDCDKPGVDAMWAIGHKLLKSCPQVKIILVTGKPDGWDAADAVAEGWTWDTFKAWAVPLLKTLDEDGGRGYEYFNTATGTGADAAPETGGGDAAPTGTGQPGNGSGRNGTAGEGAARGREAATGDRSGGGHSQLQTGSAGETVPADRGGPAGEGPAHRILNWERFGLDKNGQGVPVNNLNNAVTILEHDPLLNDKLWYDTFLQRILTREGDAVRPWTEADDINLTLDFQRRHGIVRMSRDIVSQAVTAIAMRKLKNCLLEWLTPLQWDGESRVEHFFEDHFGAAATEYTRAVSRIFWLSMVARALEPGCKVDTTIVLEGEQGRGKSQAVEVVGGAWYMEQKEDVEGKDFFQVLKGKWVVEISEMESFSRAEMSRVKQAISCRVDTYRGTYARDPEDHPRQCVFVITTNNYSWNRDESGARRFLPIRCVGGVDLKTVRKYREQLFAEAVSLYNAPRTCGECQSSQVGRCERHDWWTTPLEATRNEQQDRFDADPWMDPILEYVAIKSEVNVTEILEEALKVEKSRMTRADQMRVAGCLRFAGWSKGGKARIGHSTVKIWKRADEQ